MDDPAPSPHVSTKHDFSKSDFCPFCGAFIWDAEQGDIGCEAGPGGNPPAYPGFALTPAEQAAGLTASEKARARGYESPDP